MMMGDRILYGVFGILFLGLVALAIWLIPREIDRADRAQAIAQAQGCEYVGRARDLHSIYFMDCGGEIRMTRIKE